MNKAWFFDNKVKTEKQLSALEIINILVEIGQKMVAILEEMRKLLPEPQPEPIRLPIPSPRGTPLNNKATIELKTPL